MANIVPAVLESDIKEVQKKLDQLADLTEWVQIDLMDGQFVDNISVKPEELKLIKTDINLEAHLMVKQPEKWLDYLPDNIFKRVYFHIEAVKKPEELINKIKDKGFQAGIALNLETPFEDINELFDRINHVLFMSIKPGWQGQELKKKVLEKISSFKEQYPSQIVAIDGGVNMSNIFQVAQAGADNISVGSAIFSEGEIAQNFNNLKDQLT